MRLSTAVRHYIEDLKAVTPSPHTIKAYETDLLQLARHCGKRDEITAFTPDGVRAYFAWLMSQDYAMSSISRKASTAREFARWGMRKGLWAKNPLDDPHFRFKRPPPNPKPFDRDEVRRIMDLPLTGAENVVRALLYYTGLRVGAICDLKIGDVSFSHIDLGDGLVMPGSVSSVGKGRRVTTVPLDPKLRSILWDWLEAHPGKRHEPLLRYPDGQPLRRKTIGRMVAQWGKEAGVAKAHPHRFRHTFATDLLHRGVPIQVVQKLMGHASIQTTMIYTKVADNQLVEAILRRSN